MGIEGEPVGLLLGADPGLEVAQRLAQVIEVGGIGGRAGAATRRPATAGSGQASSSENTLMTTTPPTIIATPTMAAQSMVWCSTSQPTSTISAVPTPAQMA